jgi:hypothetical protein
LVEVLVAFAILALTFGFAFQAFSGAFDWLGRSRSSDFALALARSTLARVGHDIALADGTVSGHGENGLTWRVDTAPYGDPRQILHGPLAGHRVEVTVAWTEHHQRRELRLTTLRLGPAGQGS